MCLNQVDHMFAQKAVFLQVFWGRQIISLSQVDHMFKPSLVKKTKRLLSPEKKKNILKNGRS